MKTYKQILATIKQNAENIENMTSEIIKLDAQDEKREAIQGGNIDAYKAIKAEADSHADKIAKLSEEIYILKIENAILNDNLKVAYFDFAYPAIVEALTKYNGKKYGEKTREAIRDEVRTKGISFYFDGYGAQDTICIRALNDSGTYDYTLPEIRAHVTDRENPFISSDNTINAGAEAFIYEKYTENPRKQAKAIIKAYEAHKQATAKARASMDALNALLPSNIKGIRNIDTVYQTLNI